MNVFYVSCNGNMEERGIYEIILDADNFKLYLSKKISTLGLPTYIIKKNDILYISFKNDHLNQGAGIGSYQIINGNIEELSFFNSGRSYCHLCVDNYENYLFTANYNVGATALYKVDNHKVIQKLNSYHHSGHGPDILKRQVGPHAHCVGFTPDYEYVYSVDLGADKIYLFDYKKSYLHENSLLSLNILPGSGPRHMIFSSDGNYAYIVNEITNTLFVYKYRNYHFYLIQSIHTVPRHFNGFSSASAIKMNHNGNYLFVSNRGHDSIAMYRVNKDNGKLTLLYMVHTKKDPIDFSIVDNYLLVTCFSDHIIQVMSFDESKELLELTDLSLELTYPTCICNT